MRQSLEPGTGRRQRRRDRHRWPGRLRCWDCLPAPCPHCLPAPRPHCSRCRHCPRCRYCLRDLRLHYLQDLRLHCHQDLSLREPRPCRRLLGSPQSTQRLLPLRFRRTRPGSRCRRLLRHPGSSPGPQRPRQRSSLPNLRCLLDRCHRWPGPHLDGSPLLSNDSGCHRSRSRLRPQWTPASPPPRRGNPARPPGERRQVSRSRKPS